jgi:hypothetical protein
MAAHLTAPVCSIQHVLCTRARHFSLSPARSILVNALSSDYFKIHFRLYSPLQLGLPSLLLPSGFYTKTMYIFLFCPICAICPARLGLLDLTIQILSDEDYKYRSSSCNFLQTPVTSISISSSHLYLGLRNNLFPSYF